jgi:type II secretory pathway pseudopilin PulG
MKQIISTLAVIVLVGLACIAVYKTSQKRFDTKIKKFNDDAATVIQGLQQYKEFVGSYPAGTNNLDIVRTLQGRTDKKVRILSVQKSDLNEKGEMLDPWGTPLMFFFSGNTVLIRSAGPNKAWEDSSIIGGDDLFRTN